MSERDRLWLALQTWAAIAADPTLSPAEKRVQWRFLASIFAVARRQS